MTRPFGLVKYFYLKKSIISPNVHSTTFMRVDNIHSCELMPRLPLAAPSMGLGANPPKCRSAPAMKQTAEESIVNCAKFSNFDRFCSQNLNDVGKLLQLLEDSLTGLRLWTSLGNIRPQTPVLLNENCWRRALNTACLTAQRYAGVSTNEVIARRTRSLPEREQLSFEVNQFYNGLSITRSAEKSGRPFLPCDCM